MKYSITFPSITPLFTHLQPPSHFLFLLPLLLPSLSLPLLSLSLSVQLSLSHSCTASLTLSPSLLLPSLSPSPSLTRSCSRWLNYSSPYQKQHRTPPFSMKNSQHIKPQSKNKLKLTQTKENISHREQKTLQSKILSFIKRQKSCLQRFWHCRNREERPHPHCL